MMENPTKFIVEPNKQEVFIIREFDYPREMVFKAHEDPELLVQWLGPDNRKVKIDYYDSRTGGSYRYLICNQAGKEVAAFNGVIHEVTFPERIMQTFEYEGLPERGHVTLDTILFEDLPGKRCKVTIHSVFRSLSDRDGMMQSGVETGVNEGYVKLEKLLALMGSIA
ncbi:SRPBCC family protein [Pollutibacter soli]|uniref:SRPBCC family protein n=1 Tax=Pollutibacter soli TaxID=3034157 RepID=UPI0030134F0A